MNMNEKRIQKPTRIPYALLSLKGRLDARRSKDSVDAYCDKLCLREMAIEARAVTAMEHETHFTRETASRQLAFRQQYLARLAQPPFSREGEDSATVRLRRQDAQERLAAQRGLYTCEQELISLHETLTHARTLLEERMTICRAQTMEAIRLYRKDVLPGFPSDPYQGTLGTNSMSAYLARHEVLDAELEHTVEQLRREEAA